MAIDASVLNFLIEIHYVCCNITYIAEILKVLRKGMAIHVS
mgnify:FL=1